MILSIVEQNLFIKPLQFSNVQTSFFYLWPSYYYISRHLYLAFQRFFITLYIINISLTLYIDYNTYIWVLLI